MFSSKTRKRFKRLILLQLTSLGDIFQQSYSLTAEDRDTTCSSGPGSQLVTLTEDALQLGAEWLRKAEAKHELEADVVCDSDASFFHRPRLLSGSCAV